MHARGATLWRFGAITLFTLSLAARGTVNAQELPAPQTRPERIVGRVVTDSGIPIPGAEVIVTRGPDRAIQRDTTAADGLFEIAWNGGTGDYLLFVSAPGRAPVRRRLLRSAADDSVFVVDVVLLPLVAQLAPIAVTATRPKPRRNEGAISESVGGTDWAAGENSRLLPPEEFGDLAALAATIPGMIRTGDGVSALGLDAAQNQTTLDGLGFLGGHIPREAAVSRRVSTSPYDPARGGFSGAQLSLDFHTGSLFSRANASASLDAPVLQSQSSIAGTGGGRYHNARLSGGADGPWGRTDAYRYNLSAEVTRRSAETVSLFSASTRALLASGISPAAVAGFRSVLQQVGAPLGEDVSQRTVQEQLTVLGRFDRTGFDWNRSEDRPHSGAITLYAQARNATPIGLTPVAIPTYGGRTNGETVALQALYSGFIGAERDRLLELRSSYSLRRDASEPVTAMPAGVVLGIVETGASPAAAPMLFGGNPALTWRQRLWVWESTGEAQWFAAARHRIKVTASSRLDGLSADRVTNPFGTFTFQSVDDLLAGTPSSYTRTLDRVRGSGAVWNGALTAGDFWRPHRNVELVFGGRLEFSRFLESPLTNTDVESAFGVTSKTAPTRVHLSPRAGFSWHYARGAGAASAGPMAALGVRSARPSGVIRGGFGEFRSLYMPGVIADARAFSGDRDTRLVCISEAAPVPDWPLYAGSVAAIPRECEVGGAHADASRDVVVIDPSFDVPRSWRSNLAWSGSWRRLAMSAEGILSFNRRQPGRMELNLIEAPVATLASEGNRPLYAAPGTIDPETGQFPPASARVDPRFGRVTSIRNDLRSQTSQLVLGLQPEFGGGSHLFARYALTSARGEHRGLGGAAFGDVRTAEWSRGNLNVRHHFVIAAGRTLSALAGTTVTLFATAQSGFPYTPLVSGDVNGDGLTNDRAFIHSPATARSAGDDALASATEALLSDAPARARDCLMNQVDQPARRNSCEGPWSATLNARLDLPWRFVRAGVGDRRRVRVAINVVNVLGGLDQLLHGSAGMHGWGSVFVPNPVLYTVTGFEPVSQRYRYSVNPAFGQTQSGMIGGAPFRVTIDVSMDLGVPVEVQQVRRFLAPGRTRPGVALDSAALHARYARNLPNVFRLVLRDADSLFLSRDQVERLEHGEREYQAKLNALWGTMATEFAQLPANFSASAALRRQEEFVARAWDINRDGARSIAGILTPLQLRLAHGTVQYLASETGPIRIRVSQ